MVQLMYHVRRRAKAGSWVLTPVPVSSPWNRNGSYLDSILCRRVGGNSYI